VEGKPKACPRCKRRLDVGNGEQGGGEPKGEPEEKAKVGGAPKPEEGEKVMEGAGDEEPLIFEDEEPVVVRVLEPAAPVYDTAESQVRPRKEKSVGEAAVPKRGKLSAEEYLKLSRSEQGRAMQEGRF